jgi:uncharacterized protein YggU (UPF0235/DUF167 family)
MLELSGDTLKVLVTAPPEDGRANEAVVALLAGEWRLPKSAFAVIRGSASRHKTIGIAGEPAALAGRVVEWMKRHG